MQDLVDSVSNEQLDGDYSISGPARRHQQNSRFTKYSSSVSSRQREGGSLPSNVNHPVSFGYVDVDSILFPKYTRGSANNSGKNKESYENDRNVTTVNSSAHHSCHHNNRNALIADNHNRDELAQSIATTSNSTSASSTNDKPHTIINIDDPDETRHLLAHDSLAQVFYFSQFTYLVCSNAIESSDWFSFS